MTAVKVQIRRLATGVPGLDAVLGGGLPEFSFNLVAGHDGLFGGRLTRERAHLPGDAAPPASPA